jgi:hypothetical protein
MSRLTLSCPHCQARLTSRRDKVQTSITCPRCRRVFTTAPGQGPPPPPPQLAPTAPGKSTLLLLGAAAFAFLLLLGGTVLLVVLLGRQEGSGQRAGSPETRETGQGNGAPPSPAPGSPKGEPAEKRASPTRDWEPSKEVPPGSRGAGGASIAPGKLALVVGVRDYDSGKLEPLRYTENDAEDLAGVLAEQGGFAVRLLTSSRGKKEAADAPTAANLRGEIKVLLARKRRDDTVLVALSGHGIQAKVNDREESFFCPADAQLNDHGTLLALGQLFRDLDECGAGVKLLLVDACRNDPSLGRNVDVDALPRLPRGTAALFSCKSGERAFETPKLGKGHGVFFHHVIEGLRGKAKNKRGEVTWGGLVEHVTEAVSDDVPRIIGGGAKQTPELKVNLTGKSPVLVAGSIPTGPTEKGPTEKGSDSPEAVFAAAKAAGEKGDLRGYYAHCTADNAKVNAGMLVSFHFYIRSQAAKGDAFWRKTCEQNAAVLARHGLSEEELNKVRPSALGMTVTDSATSYTKATRANLNAFRVMGGAVKDPIAFIDEMRGDSRGKPYGLTDTALTALRIDGDRATGTMVYAPKEGKGAKASIAFVKTAGGWKIDAPPPED